MFVKHIPVVVSSLVMALAVAACAPSEPASAPSVAEIDKAAVEEKLNRQDSRPNETEADNKRSEDIAFSTQAETDDPTDSDGRNILVAYFSRADENYNVGTIDKGNTQIIAEYIASEVGADSYHIETVNPYPANYDDCCDVAKKELADKARPEIQGGVENMEQYDIVFLGYPIWWGDMPMAVYTFMDSYDFSDKVVIPFNTHEGSGESGTYSAIGSYLPNAQVLDGMPIQGKTAQEFNSDTQQAVRDWLDDLGF